MAHWHDFNPWATHLIYVPSIAEAKDAQYENYVFHYYGVAVDAYILAQPSGQHSLGIRYGKEPEDYLSPPIAQDKAEQLIKKYGSKRG